ncbi:MAG: flagellar FlbD family protein [Anaerolineales bacterium]|nr:flagellar FlbD family protein [Anaerolineales bacterium]
MIKVTRLNGKVFYINAELIQFVEATPDTVISFTNDVKIVVRESVDVVVGRIKAYKQELLAGVHQQDAGA